MLQRKFDEGFAEEFEQKNKIDSYCAEGSEYVTWIKKELEEARKRPKRMFIYVEGGLIQTIVTDGCMDILVLDGDTDGLDGVDKYVDLGGDEFKARSAWESHPDNNKRIVDHYFDQQKKLEE